VPLYEYQCKTCGHRFEVIQKFSDAPVRKCPKCGKAVERLVSSSAIQFKGTGWYVTDYARKGATSGSGKQAKSEKDKTGESAKPDKAESKTEASKPSPSSTRKE
jgi:putative FmdB family regulatory protein